MFVMVTDILILVLLSTSSIRACSLFINPRNVFCRTDASELKNKTLVEVFANHLDSTEFMLPYDDSYFNFCSIADGISIRTSLGHNLLGDRIRSSPYKFQFRKDESCHHVCTKKYESSNIQQQKMLQRLMKGIISNYQHYWTIDSLPVRTCYISAQNEEICTFGVPIGCYITKNGETKHLCNFREKRNDTFYVFNHIDFEITYGGSQHRESVALHDEDCGSISVVKVQVRSLNSDKCNYSSEALMFQSTTEYINIPFTYTIKFVKGAQNSWGSRWHYLFKSIPQTDIEGFSVSLSLIIILFLLLVIAIIRFCVSHENLTRDIWYDKNGEIASCWVNTGFNCLK
ncbi:unnamed protein product [Rotaria magnacalcarata]|nr:unnamed protein product [Rotaria magnacalcarata]CAF3832070.1 unnamed protein product [Rotaria magnacalcarata]